MGRANDDKESLDGFNDEWMTEDSLSKEGTSWNFHIDAKKGLEALSRVQLKVGGSFSYGWEVAL